jgi:hypothetical protein
MLTNLTEARPLNRSEMKVKTPNGGQRSFGLVDCAATLDFVFGDFVRHFSLQTHKSKGKALVRLVTGQRVTCSMVCETTFEVARDGFKRKFYVLRDLRVADLMLGWPWLNDKEAYVQFGMTRVFTLMDGTIVEIQTKEGRLECSNRGEIVYNNHRVNGCCPRAHM